MRSGSNGDVSVRNRILAELHRTLRSLADEQRTLGAGWALRSRSLPLVWSLNELRITSAAAVGEVIDLAEEHQADLYYLTSSSRTTQSDNCCRRLLALPGGRSTGKC
jgi:hypothetical protein